MATLLSTIDNSGPASFYSKKYRQMVEDHLLVLRNMNTNTIRQITSDDWADLNRYVGDFYGFLSAMRSPIPKHYHWTVMRVNGFRSRFELDRSLEHLVIPDYEYLDKLAQLSKEKR